MEKVRSEDALASKQASGEELGPDPALVRKELQKILTSRAFHASRRGKQFLEYVVCEKLNGQGDVLKERTIGVQLFGRKPDYSTGEDPVVRVQAGDVRHRLERYYADPDTHSDVQIVVPLGSYAPVFQMTRARQSQDHLSGDLPVLSLPLEEAPERQSADITPGVSLPPEIDGGVPGATVDPEPIPIQHAEGLPFITAVPGAAPGPAVGRRYPFQMVLGIVLVCVMCFILAGWYFHQHTSASRAFWLPASASSKPVLLCLPKPMVYRPSDKLFDRYERSHPDARMTREARQDRYLPLDPSDSIQWSDMIPSYNAGPGIGGVVAALNMSKLLTEQGIQFEVRFGDEATYTEMRGSPAVVVGAINTNWSMELTSESHFVFDETVGAPSIMETLGTKRTWKMEGGNGHTTRDYGLITRQTSSKTGQFLVQVAGISHYGTEAASEMLLKNRELTDILRKDAVNLEKRNLQMVVSTDITNGRAGPPRIVAVENW